MRDTDTDRISAGVEAESILARLRPHFDRKRDYTINTLISHHKAETLTDGIMRSGIAMLAAIGDLESDLSHRVRLGHKDLEESQRP